MSPILAGSAADTGLKIDSVEGSEPKVCTKCGQSKPLSEFYKYSSSVALTRKNVRFERPVIDHDHMTGAIRGLLCSRCNTVLGQAGDGPTVLLALVAYLKRDALNQELRIVGDAG